MPRRKNVDSLDDAPVDVFAAVKRAFLRRGIVRGQHGSRGKPPKAVKEGVPETTASEETEDSEAPEKLVDLTVNAHEILFKAKTVFPFTLFPDDVTIDREKLTVANRSFFQVAEINSVPISDIQSVQVHIGPFFGSLSILRTTMTPTPAPITVQFLWREDALKAQRLLQGYIIAGQKKIDCAAIEREQLIVLLNDLGQGVSD